MATTRPTLQDSALLVIDVQDSFKATPRWERRSNPALEVNVDRLIQAYRAAALPVFFILHSDQDEPFRTTSPHYRLMDFLKPGPDEPVLHKTTRNCFTSTPLQRMLTQRGIRRLAITGIQMEQCWRPRWPGTWWSTSAGTAATAAARGSLPARENDIKNTF